MLWGKLYPNVRHHIRLSCFVFFQNIHFSSYTFHSNLCGNSVSSIVKLCWIIRQFRNVSFFVFLWGGWVSIIILPPPPHTLQILPSNACARGKIESQTLMLSQKLKMCRCHKYGWVRVCDVLLYNIYSERLYLFLDLINSPISN